MSELSILLSMIAIFVSLAISVYLAYLASRFVHAVERIAAAIDGPGFFNRPPQRVAHDADGGS